MQQLTRSSSFFSKEQGMNAIDRIAILVGNLTIAAATTGLLNPNFAIAQQGRVRELLAVDVDNGIRSPDRLTLRSTKLRQYPPKVIASKQAIGRLRSFVWGDYLYAEFITQTGTISFFIDNLEDCLLDKYRGKTITIRYNISDIYLPQASSHRVNLIQKIAGIDVHQWRKSRSRSQLQQCRVDR
jgi:hypothetical protein